MSWQIYTKPIEIEGGTALRWFWREPRSWRESPVGFTSYAACAADAARYGYVPKEEPKFMARYWNVSAA